MNQMPAIDKQKLLKAHTAGLIFDDRSANKENGRRDPFPLLLIQTRAMCQFIMRPFK